MITNELKQAYSAAKQGDSAERNRIIGELQRRKTTLETTAKVVRQTAAQMKAYEERKKAFGARDSWMMKRPDTSEEEALGLEAEALATEEVARRIMMLDLAPAFHQMMKEESENTGQEFWEDRAKAAAERRDAQVNEFEKHGMKPAGENSNTFVREDGA